MTNECVSWNSIKFPEKNLWLTISSHWWTATATCVPSGLVNTNTSPGTALSGLRHIRPWHWYGAFSSREVKVKENQHVTETHSYMMNSLGWHTVVATPPITTQGLTTVCPPVTDVPASSEASLNPWMISGMTLSLSCKHTRLSKGNKRVCVGGGGEWKHSVKNGSIKSSQTFVKCIVKFSVTLSHIHNLSDYKNAWSYLQKHLILFFLNGYTNWPINQLNVQ